jgi:glycosyltransferase involved in cell wall biosynthesis
LDGGTGTFVDSLSRLYEQYPGHYQIKIISLTAPSFRPSTHFSLPLSIMKNQFHDLDVYRFSLKTFLALGKELYWVSREARQFHPDIILTIDSHCAFLGSFYTLFHPSVRLLLTIHNNLRAVTFQKLSPFGRRCMIFFCRALFQVADGVVGVSQGVSQDIEKLFFPKHHVMTIYNGLPIKVNHKSYRLSPVSFRPMSRNLKMPDQVRHDRRQQAQSWYPVLVSVGRLALQKDFDTLLSAVWEVKKVYPHVRLFVIGDGSERKRLEALTVRLHLTKNVLFEGWQSSIDTYVSQSDMFILSSHYEGFSYVVLEAMKKRLPVISTNTPYGPAELLDNGKAGILVPPSKPKEMAEAIISLVKNKKRYQELSSAALSRSAYFSEEKMLQKYHAVFLSILGSERKNKRSSVSSGSEPIL